MSDTLIDTVRTKYGQTATAGLSSDDAGVRAVAEAFGYTADELRSIPAAANMGLSCGNPLATAHLRPGEVVVDLGSGGGLDVFLAAQRVGPAGKAIGVDMTPEMLELARRNAAEGGYTNAEFVKGTIDAIPLPDASADVVISNCVINLAPDKDAVFREIFRILKPGGRVAVSDIALKKTLPDDLRDDVMAYVGCIAGAIQIDAYVAGLRAAGFAEVVVVDSGADLNAYAQVEGQSGCCSPAAKEPVPPVTPAEPRRVSLSLGTGCCGSTSTTSTSGDACCAPSPATPAAVKTMHKDLGDLLSRHDVNAYAASVKVFAVKPA
jgi:SAM-dependent methyltransferase